MFDFLAGLLAELYKLWPSYGGAIILFTALIMLVLSPLSIKSTRSMIAMQRVGPEVKKLQQKHKGDREALNREMMEFYKEHNINPFSSCLPLLLQLPVFFVLYQVLIGLTRRLDPGDPMSLFNPKYLEGENTPLAVALRGTNEMMSFGMDLSQSALTELRSGGLVVAIPFVVLIVLVVSTAVIQQRQVQGRNPAASANPQQQMIAKVIPFIFVPISVSLPAGVVVYFVVSNLVRIGQQALVTRLDFKEDRSTGDDGDAGSNKAKKPLPSGDGGKDEKGAAKKGGSSPKAIGSAGSKDRSRQGKGSAAAKRPTSKGSAGKGANGKSPNAKNSNSKNSNAKRSNTKETASGNGSAGSNRGGGAAAPAPRPRKRKRKRR